MRDRQKSPARVANCRRIAHLGLAARRKKAAQRKAAEVVDARWQEMHNKVAALAAAQEHQRRERERTRALLQSILAQIDASERPSNSS